MTREEFTMYVSRAVYEARATQRALGGPEPEIHVSHRFADRLDEWLREQGVRETRRTCNTLYGHPLIVRNDWPEAERISVIVERRIL